MFRLKWPIRALHQSQKGFLQDVFRLAVAQTQRPSVQKQLRGFVVIKPLAPILCRFVAHVSD